MRHPLHPPRHPVEAFQRLQQPITGQAVLEQHPHRLQQVHQIEAAHQRRVERDITGRAMQHAFHACGAELQAIHEQLSAGIFQRTAPALIPQPLRQPAAMGVIAVHHRLTLEIGRGKQLGLGLEVVLEGGVIVEVVLAEVGEHRPRKTAARHPGLIEGMGAHFHRCHGATRRLGSRQISLQLIGKRGGVHRRAAMARPAIRQGAHQGGGAAAGQRQVLNQMGGGGFAVGAGDPDQRHLIAGVIPKRCS